MLFLKVKQGNHVIKNFKFYQRRHIKIGRWRNNHIIIDDQTVSGHHAIIDSDDGDFFVLNDLNSRNGTYVNGQAVVSHTLKSGDVIAIGECSIIYEHKAMEKKLDAYEASKNPETIQLDPK